MAFPALRSSLYRSVWMYRILKSTLPSLKRKAEIFPSPSIGAFCVLVYQDGCRKHRQGAHAGMRSSPRIGHNPVEVAVKFLWYLASNDKICHFAFEPAGIVGTGKVHRNRPAGFEMCISVGFVMSIYAVCFAIHCRSVRRHRLRRDVGRLRLVAYRLSLHCRESKM